MHSLASRFAGFCTKSPVIYCNVANLRTYIISLNVIQHGKAVCLDIFCHLYCQDIYFALLIRPSFYEILFVQFFFSCMSTWTWSLFHCNPAYSVMCSVWTRHHLLYIHLSGLDKNSIQKLLLQLWSDALASLEMHQLRFITKQQNVGEVLRIHIARFVER